jgi:hypothetical protein
MFSNTKVNTEQVFNILWSEPIGANSTEITAYGEIAFAKIRRFLIIRSERGYSICM